MVIWAAPGRSAAGGAVLERGRAAALQHPAVPGSGSTHLIIWGTVTLEFSSKAFIIRPLQRMLSTHCKWHGWDVGEGSGSEDSPIWHPPELCEAPAGTACCQAPGTAADPRNLRSPLTAPAELLAPGLGSSVLPG